MERGEIFYSIKGKKQIINFQLIGISCLISGILCFIGFIVILPDTTSENSDAPILLFSCGIGFFLGSYISINFKSPEYIVYENGILIPSSPTHILSKEGLFVSFNDIENLWLSDDSSKIFIKARDDNNRLHQYVLISDNPQLLYEWIEYGQSNFLENYE